MRALSLQVAALSCCRLSRPGCAGIWTNTELLLPLQYGLGTIFRPDFERLIDSEAKLVAVVARNSDHQALVTVIEHSIGCDRWLLSRNGATHDCRDRVDIGPRPHSSLGLVLLDGGVAVRDDARHGHGFTDRLACTAEINQDRLTALIDEDVFRLDVPVEQSVGMNFLKARKNWSDHRHEGRLVRLGPDPL